MFGEFGCVPMIAFGKTKILSAFKMLSRARKIDPQIANEISKQIQIFEKDKKHIAEENQDDPDFDIDEYISIENYIDEKYIPIINDSKKYQNIIVTQSPHPCAHITYHKDMREHIGLIRLNSKTGKKEIRYCAFIDGVTADKLNYTKSDLLRVDVVKIISESFKESNLEVMPVTELLKKIDGDENIWNLYANGFTQCLNQTEQEASTKKVMRFRPQNIAELSAFIAAIRPGFASNLEVFLNRTIFNYGIPALDKLLLLENTTGNTAKSSFLMYDEQILRCLKFAGIPGPEAYATIKNIKKKHKDKVLTVKEKFKTGFVDYLINHENASEKLALEITEKAWRVIEDSASYLFCASHATAMACDSVYCAYLKAYYPFEFYKTILKLYDEKGNKNKIVLIIQEMKRYKHTEFIPCLYGQNNTDWTIDKENNILYASLSSVKFMSKIVAKDLLSVSNKKFDYFVDLLRYLQMETCVDTRQIEILISLGYFAPFYKTAKCMNIAREFFEGESKITKNYVERTVEKRLIQLRTFEKECADTDLSIAQKVNAEFENIGMCISTTTDPEYKNCYYIKEVDSSHGVKVYLYNLISGNNSLVRIAKDKFEKFPVEPKTVLHIQRCRKSPRKTFKNGRPEIVPDEFDWWLQDYMQRKIPILKIKERSEN